MASHNKIVILPDPATQVRVFDPSHLTDLEGLGELVLNRVEGKPTAEGASRLLAGADIAITSWGCVPFTQQMLEAAPNLKAVIHAAGTVKGVVTPELWRRGIRVSSGNEHLGYGVAETALGLTIASLKNMWQLTRSTAAGGWGQGKDRIREMYQVSIGIIGAGKAGRHFIKLLQNFSIKIFVADPYITPEEARAIGATKLELEELMSVCDVVSIHAPYLQATHHLINEERLALMKDDAILINTARGKIIDESALIAELSKGRLFACLDVTDPEPPAVDNPLRGLPNCIITPHIAGAVNNGVKRLGQFAVDEAALFFSTAQLSGEVKEEQLSIVG